MTSPAALGRITPEMWTMPFAGYSMFPFLRPGDRLVVRKTRPQDLRIGQVVLVKGSSGNGFAARQKLTAHRIVGIDSRFRIITKGDNLPRPDPVPANPADVRGQVALVVRNRWLVSRACGLRSPTGRWIARLSIRNITPGLVLSGLKSRLKRW